MRAISPARVARSLVAILVLTVIQVAAPAFNNSALAYTQGTVTNGTSYGGTGGNANGANQNCTNGAIVAIGTSKSGDNLNTFMFVCKTINNDASLSTTEATTNVFGTPAESDRCAAGQIGIGVRVIASNGGTLVGGVGLICGNAMSQGGADTRAIMPNASSAGTVYTYNCPTGQLLAGFALRTGALVDQIIPKCSSFSGFVYGAVGAPSATVTGSTASVSFATVTGSIADTALTYTVTAVPNTGSTITVTGSSSPISMPGMVLRANYTITVTASNTYGTAASTSNTSATMLLPGGDTDTALTLNGSTQYADVTDTTGSPFDTTGTFTIEAWVNPADACPVAGAIVAKLSYMLYCNYGVWYVMALANGSTGSGVTTGVAVEPNEWHHLAATKSSSSGDILFYYDGVYVKTVASGATSMTANNTAFQIGHWDNYTYYYKGQIDEVRFYNSQRTATQVLNDMKTYGGVSDSDLMAYYDFNEGTGTTLYNRKTGATSATDLTIAGSPSWSDIKTTDTTTLPAYTILKFPRTYITNVGGWRVPAGIPKVSALVIAGGGGGGARAAGGGGAGGLVYRQVLTLTGGSIETITIGQGGLGGYSMPAFTNRQGLNGQDTQMGSHTTAMGGGGGGGAGDAGNTYRVGLNGGSGGGASGDAAGNGSSAAYGYGQQSSSKGYGLGRDGGSGMSGTYWNGGGGGGSTGPGQSASTTSWVAGNGGTGTLDPVGGSNLCLAAGGGGGTINTGTSAGAGGTCSSGTVTAGAGTIGAVVAGSATANSGSGGGGSGYNGSDVGGGHGGSGVIYIRWITAAKPAYTAPTTAYLNVGMTETFTTNVAVDSATVNLTRTFRWESSTTGSNGTFSLIKQGTGAANAVFAWVPLDTATTGSNFVYRVIVTDSDTAGLFIVDTSTPVWAVINRALVVSGNSTIGKAINVSKNETFTVTYGTSTYRPTMSPAIPGITLDTSTAGSPVIKIGDTVTVGTYYETLTVVDSVSATIVTPLTIIVSPPPSFSATSNQVDSSTVLYLDAGNSASLTPSSPATWRDMSGRNLQVNFPPSSYPVGTTSCTAPSYSSNYQGILNFATDTCGYLPNVGTSNVMSPYTYQTWVKRNGDMGTASIDGDYTSIVATPWTGGRQIGLTLHWRHVLNSADYYLEAGVWGNPGWYSAQWATAIPVNTWVFVTVTFTGSAITISVNDQTAVTATVSTTLYAANIDTGLIFGKRFDQGAGYYFNGSLASFRLYNRVLSGSEITQNYNATKTRFDSANQNQITPSQKYGQNQFDTFTVTSGYGTKVTTFVTGDRTGIDWDTTTVTNQVKLSVQDSLTVGTYYDTMTVTDSLGQSSYLPIKVSISKADTITVTIRNPKTLVYTGSPAASIPDIAITGLVSSDTGTATRLYSAPASVGGAPETYTALVNSAVIPTNVETYTVSAATLTSLTVGSLSNYQGVVYETSTLTITQAKQPYLTVNYFGAIAGSSFTLYSGGGAGGGAITETVTAGGSGTNCAITGHVLSNQSGAAATSTCSILITKAASRNYKVETLTATIYFLAFANNQQSQTGAGTTIGINGINTVSLDTTTAPTISGLSTYTLSLATNSGTFTITGAGFGLVPITVKFWRNKSLTVTSSDGSTLSIPIASITALAPTTGKVMVITANGIAVSIDSLTITP